MSKQVLYALRDVAHGNIFGTAIQPNVSLLIRDVSPVLAKQLPHFDEDLDILEIGYFEDLGFHPIDIPVIHDWSEYTKPETKPTPLTDEQKKDFDANPVEVK